MSEFKVKCSKCGQPFLNDIPVCGCNAPGEIQIRRREVPAPHVLPELDHARISAMLGSEVVGITGKKLKALQDEIAALRKAVAAAEECRGYFECKCTGMATADPRSKCQNCRAFAKFDEAMAKVPE